MTSAASRLSRREFLQSSAVLGGLLIGFAVPEAGRLARAGTAPAKPGPFVPNAFLHIGRDGVVTVLLAHSEMGQGIWTALPMLIAEELDADWSKIRVEHAPAAAAYAHTEFGAQMTGGSTSTWTEFERYRRAGATARALLVAAAAARFGVSAGDCRTENGVVICGTRRAGYGELADAAAKLPVPDSVTIALKEPKDWKLIGKSTKRLDTPEKITGRAQFGIDVQFDGLKTALVARAPVFGASLRSFDANAALAVPGVIKVVQVPTGVAVVAEHFWAAKLGRDALKVDWDAGTGASLDGDALRAEFRRLAGTPGAVAARAGGVESALKRAARTIEAEYSVPYLAHAPMEPLNCTVRIQPDRCDVWTGTQFQTVDQKVVSGITGLKLEQVRIHTTFLGGGFGRRATPDSDFVAEAAQVAKAAALPVKTVWTREDDMRGGYYRSAFLHRARIGLDAAGLPVAWHQVIVGQSLATGTPFESMMIHDGVDHTSVEGAADSPYLKAVAHHRVDLHSPKTAISVLWWRSVGHSHTGFVMESLVDELAHAAKTDPVVYRRRLLKDHPRHLAALDLAAAKAGWDKPPPAGRARGVAVHASFGSFCAQVAEVSVEGGAIRVHQMVCAVDCGTAVNPGAIAAQMESAVAFAMSAALYGALTIRAGGVQESNFHDYPVLRISGMPRVETHIVPSSGSMGGIGETGVPPVAPAIANAVFALTGQRLRQLPLRLAV
jgi:isoquinoline 1-oxidoreductase beta subunit